jgi:hypothetical protein
LTGHGVKGRCLTHKKNRPLRGLSQKVKK